MGLMIVLSLLAAVMFASLIMPSDKHRSCEDI